MLADETAEALAWPIRPCTNACTFDGVIRTTLCVPTRPLMLSVGIVWKLMLPSAISENVSARLSRLTPSVSSDEPTALSRFCT